MHLYKGDIYFSLLLAYFLNWGYALSVPEYTWLNVGRIAMNFLLLAVMIEVVLMLTAYLRHKPLFGQAKSTYFSWGRAVPVSLVLPALYAGSFYLMMSKPIEQTHFWALLVLAGLGFVVLMLYCYSLVQREKDS
ncbi:MAG: hypothetical protein J5678_02645 [Bacteroidaceae bacterium]|nr:hypothetical protein [Bacteroidaceae bacterium]